MNNMIMAFLSDFYRFSSYFDTFTFFLALIIVGIIWWYVTVPSNLPPGPIGFPVIGNFFSFGTKKFEKDFAKISEKYGDICRVYLGSKLVIILGNYDVIKEAFIKQGEIFSGRPQDIMFKISEEDKGIIISDGEVWKEHRRFLITTMRDFGVGKLSLEPSIKEEIQCLCNEVAKAGGKPQDFRSPIHVSVSNVINALAFGHRYDYNDERYRQFLIEVQDSGRLIGKMSILTFFPWLKYIPGIKWILGFHEFKGIIKKFEEFMKTEIEAHKKALVDGSRKDYIDAFLTERKNIIEKTGNEGTFDMKELEDNLGNLFGAGSGTITTTLLWALKFLVIYPEVQEKVREEIDKVIGMERTPSTADRVVMPYTEAFLLEVSRCASIAPLNIPHSNIEETTINGYTIPKRSFIFANLWFTHHDPKYWKDPEVFQPERFLNPDAQLVKPEYLIPFSLGKRVCLGESLAKMELFLYITYFLQRFVFKPPEGVKISLDDYTTIFSRETDPFELCAIQRNEFQAY